MQSDSIILQCMLAGYNDVSFILFVKEKFAGLNVASLALVIVIYQDDLNTLLPNIR